ncbi:MAG: hypothetical protein KAW14_10005 [Candidatus Aegiribacteria sp.]|nr:hypothetical protein [Candidatus Aegiribacteria sp.]
MRKLIAMFSVISLLIVFSCGSDSTGPSGNTDYLPMAVGNQWNYSLSGYFTEAGTDTVIISGSCVSKVLEVTTHQEGFQLYAIQDSSTTTLTFPDTTLTNIDTLYAHKADTEWRRYDDTTSTDYEIFMKLPVSLGDGWIPNADEPTIMRTVLSVSETVTVPAGTYTDCANLRDSDSQEPDFYFDHYFSRGTGVVRFLISETDSTETVYMAYDLTSSIIN